MSFKMSVTDDGMDLTLLIRDSEGVAEKVLSKARSILKTRVTSKLKAMEYKATNKDGTPKKHRDIHMWEDVQTKISTDKYGYKVLKIGGGKKTGTLWHIVNDGTYRTPATHFMDDTISQSENEIQRLIDAELKKVFE